MNDITYFKVYTDVVMRKQPGSHNDTVVIVPKDTVLTGTDLIKMYHGAPWQYVKWGEYEGYINDIFLRDLSK